ncbi:MAG: hypothetical protein ACI9UA_004091 [Pseudoalteromonas tetraodonis]|jgi:hypothetical protein
MKKITLASIILASIAICTMILGSFVSYPPEVDATEMQNIYLSRIIGFGIPVLIANLFCFFNVALCMEKKR